MIGLLSLHMFTNFHKYMKWTKPVLTVGQFGLYILQGMCYIASDGVYLYNGRTTSMYRLH